MRARARRRLSSTEKTALLAVGDIQTTKNNCLYVGLDGKGQVVAPQGVATRKFTRAYLAALDNRLHFYTYLVLGNVTNGVLDLDDEDRRLISDAWHPFAVRFGGRGRR